MSQDNLFLQTEGLRSFAQSHADVVSGLTGLLNSATGASGVQTTHGAIASAVHTALSSALGNRHGSMQNVVKGGRNLAESLQAAAHSYEQVDQRSGQRARAAGEAIADPRGTAPGSSGGGSAPGGGAAGAGGGAAAGGTGAGIAGQVVGQVGQVGSQLAQAAAGVFKGGQGGGGGGGSKGLQQLVQPLMQGAQQIVQTAKQHGGHGQGGQAEGASDKQGGAAAGEDSSPGKAPTERTTLVSDGSPKTRETPS